MKRIPAITDNLKSSVNAYLIARAYAETQREIVDKIQRNILNECKYYIAEKWAERTGEERKRITEPKDTYLMEDEDHVDYLLNLRHDLEKAGYKIESDPGDPQHSYKCPALSAEWIQTKAEHLVIDSMAEMLGESDDFRHRLLCAGLDKYHQFTDLAVKFVVNSPGWVAPKV